MEHPEPGWYPDPERPGQVRYYDGEDWTTHVRDVAPSEAPGDGLPPGDSPVAGGGLLGGPPAGADRPGASSIGPDAPGRGGSSTRSILLVSVMLMVVVLAGSMFIGTLGSDDDTDPDDADAAAELEHDDGAEPDDGAIGDDGSEDADQDGDRADADPPAEPEDGPDEEPDADAGPEPPASDGSYDAPFELTIDPAASYLATLATTEGDIVLELDPAGAPIATNNLVNLARDGYYDGVVFHRVIEGFVVQGGDPTATGSGGPGYRFEDELAPAEDLVAAEGGYPRGTLAMANSGPDTNGSQFFIVHGELVELPPHYTVFGRVTDGLDVVDAIATAPTDQADRPVDDVTITTVEITEQ